MTSLPAPTPNVVGDVQPATLRALDASFESAIHATHAYLSYVDKLPDSATALGDEGVRLRNVATKARAHYAAALRDYFG